MTTTSERELRIRRNRLELTTDPNRTFLPGRNPVRHAIFAVRVGQEPTKEFDQLGDFQKPGTALGFFHEHGRKGRIAAIWD